MRPWRRFRMVLYREDRQFFMPQARDSIVVEIDVRDLDVRRQRTAVDREAVVVRRDLDLAGVEVFDRLITAAVAEL